MTAVNIVSVGKLKEDYWRAAQNEYSKRLSNCCKLKIVELNEYKISDDPSQKEILSALENEAAGMEQFLQIKGSRNVALCIEGKKLPSKALAEMFENSGISGFSTVNFFIGSSFGLSEKIKNACGLKLSMSNMTFPHQLARIMLLEQIYRSFQIIKGTKYHK